jgi:hypothetical protein
MKIPILALHLAIISLCTSSCIVPFPGTECVTCSISGSVVDAVTKKPVPGASVMWSFKPETKVETDSTGQFNIKELQEVYLLRIYSPGGEQHVPRTHPSNRLEASHPKYQTEYFMLKDLVDKKSEIVSHKKILLKPK